MKFLVSAQGNDVGDTKAEIAENIRDAVELADEYVDNGYEIEINPIAIRRSDGWTESYYELKQILAQYNDYDEFIENTSGSDILLYKNNGLLPYIEEYYGRDIAKLELEAVPSYLKIPVNAELYNTLKSKADAYNLSVAGYVLMIIECLGGEKDE